MSVPAADFETIFPANGFDYSIVPLPRRLRDGYLSSKQEVEIMAHLAKMGKPHCVFEFGTFEGFTALTLAMNTPADTKVYTLDLPAGKPRTHFQADGRNIHYMTKKELLVFKGTEYEEKIVPLLGDSATFDYSPFAHQMDFIFVDACHTYEYVKNDSEKAFGMLKKGGLILWHDYNAGHWDGVVRYLDELSRERKLYHITGTYFVVYLDNE